MTTSTPLAGGIVDPHSHPSASLTSTTSPPLAEGGLTNDTSTNPSRRRRRSKKPADNAIPTKAKLTHLVIDSGALIKGAGMTLAHAAKNFWTVPEAINEIRDKRARHNLDTLPFELKLREPSDEAMKFAARFAQQTGDLRSLSRVDLKVIALAYMLEKQETGAAHLRTSPSRPGTKSRPNDSCRANSSISVAAPKEPLSAHPPSQSSEPSNVAVTGEVSTVLDEENDDISLRADDQVASDELATLAGDVEGRDVASDEHNIERGCDTEARDDHYPEERRDEGAAGTVGKNLSDSDTRIDGDGHAGDDDDDDEWDPQETEEIAEIDSGRGHASDSTSREVFRPDDFPSLDGSKMPSQETSKNISAPSSTSDGPTSSWSVMARSNPAPFQLAPTSDPQPLPAAAPPTAQQHSMPAAARPDQLGNDAEPDTSRILNTASAFGVTSGGAEDDDGEGWVNPSNYKSRKAHGIALNGPAQLQKKVANSRGGGQCRAGCITTDFAMQNVILQVGLPLLSLDGMAIQRVKQWILRCAACFKTCTDMGRLFCPVCGNATLDRVSCSVDAKSGATRVYLRKNFKANLRGTKFSIPGVNPSQGRFEGDLLLREDQLLTGIWAQKARRKEKNINSIFGENITANVGLNVSKSADIVVGYGRKNPNAMRGRERRGKKAVKKRT